MKVLLLGFAVALSSMVYAGDKGNGGDVIVCEKNGKIKSVELLDYYENRITRGYIADLGGSELSLDDKMNILFERIKKVDSYRGEAYEASYQTFFDETNFLDGVELADVPDSAHIAFPKGCGVRQIAVHREPLLPTDSRYTISNDLWEALDNDQKAGLILHELVYREVSEQKYFPHQDSIRVRLFVGLVSSNKLIFSTNKEQYEFYQEILQFNFVTLQKVPLWLRRSCYKEDCDWVKGSFFENGNIRKGNFLSGTSFNFEGNSVTFKFIGYKADISFYETGEINYMRLPRGYNLFVKGKERDYNFTTTPFGIFSRKENQDFSVKLYKSGRIHWVAERDERPSLLEHEFSENGVLLQSCDRAWGRCQSHIE